MFFKKRHMFQLLVAIIMAAGTLSCSQADLDFTIGSDRHSGDYLSRSHSTEYRKVFLMYSAGFNNLSDDLESDIQDIIGSPLPTNSRDVFLIFSHHTAGYGNYKKKTSPTLTRISQSYDGDIICDTLLVMDAGTPSASAETMEEVLTYIRDEYPSQNYGMLFSSHGTGWLPSNHKFDSSSTPWKAGAEGTPYSTHDGLRPDGLPAVKSVGREEIHLGQGLEIDIKDFAAAIPMFLDFIVFDACLMGSVEVAYQLKDKCGHIVCSPAEILAEGMDYVTMTGFLLQNGDADLTGFAENYYNFYNDSNRNGAFRSGTITVVDCSRLEDLALVCRDIFEKHRDSITMLENKANEVQKYYTLSEHQCYYDLKDIVIKAGSSEEELNALNEALNACVPYCASTDYILNTVKVNTYSGLSMYLQRKRHTALNEYYRELEWNKATGLVQ